MRFAPQKKKKKCEQRKYSIGRWVHSQSVCVPETNNVYYLCTFGSVKSTTVVDIVGFEYGSPNEPANTGRHGGHLMIGWEFMRNGHWIAACS
jgi:hypothetical protein